MSRTILILAANPVDTFKLRLDKEVREIESGLERSKRRDDFVLEHKWATRPADLRRAVLDLKPNIVHFCGHGSGEEGLVFEDEEGQAKLIGADTLAAFFELFADKVECVVLNACYSEVQAEAVAQHIRFVVGMKEEIGDPAAIQFSVAFYDALGAGESIEFAFKLACNAIEWGDRPNENLIPVMKSMLPGNGGASQESIDWFSGIEFVWVPSGEFWMGGESEDFDFLEMVFGLSMAMRITQSEQPAREVFVDGFWIGKYQVTQEQWERVMGTNPSWFNQENLGHETRNHPVENITWYDVQDFADLLSKKTPKHLFSLPTEAEWERACRAGTRTLFHFGNNQRKLGEYGWYSRNSDGQTHPVGQLRPNPWGLYDVHGNVWEMCIDTYDEDAYTRLPRRNPVSTDAGGIRVRRGGT